MENLKNQEVYREFEDLSKKGETYKLDVIQRQLLRQLVLNEAFEHCNSSSSNACVMKIGKELYHVLDTVHTFVHGHKVGGLCKLYFQNGEYRASSNIKTPDELIASYYPQSQKLYIRFVKDDAIDVVGFEFEEEDFCLLDKDELSQAA